MTHSAGAAAGRLRIALRGGAPDRVPVLPKIWVDLAVALTGTDLRGVLEDPLTALQVVARAALSVGADGARQFHFPPRRTGWRDGRLCELDGRGAVVGRIDLQGGLATLLDDARAFRIEDPVRIAYHQHSSAEEPFVRSVADARLIAVPDRAVLRRRLGINETVLVWGAAGRLSPEKGFDVLMEAFSLLASTEEGPFLLLLGEGGEFESLDRRVRRLGLGGKVRLLGDGIGLDDLFGAADYFVLPSRWESGPLILLEAMAAGLPVVATDVGQVRQMVQAAGAGTIVPASRPRELASAMESVMSEGPAARQEARAGIPRLKEAYDFRRVQSALEDCYRAIAGCPDRHGGPN